MSPRHLRFYKRAPRHFVSTQIAGVRLEDWQKQVLDDLGNGHLRLSIRSGHGVGKTALLAWIVLWFISTHVPCKIGCTAPTAHQLEDVLWAELALWLARLNPRFRRRLRLSRLGLASRRHPALAFAVGRTARPEQPEALQGLHSPNTLIIVDEASGVADPVFDVAMGAMSTQGAIAVLAGNPTRLEGFFFDTHGRLAERWKTYRVSSESVARARGHVADIVARYGAGSNVHRVRVLGEFPLADADAVIGRDRCEAAMKRRPENFLPTGEATVWGLDVARFGSDRSALAKRCDGVLLAPVLSWRGQDTMQTVGRVHAEWLATEENLRPRRILVDVVGIGAGVFDRLNELQLPVTAVNVGEQALARERYSRQRDELWFRGRDWLQRDDAVLPADPALIDELCAATFRYNSSARIEVESKAELKRRGLPSPDLADAFLLTFAAGEHLPRPVAKERRHGAMYRRIEADARGFMRR